MWRKIGFPIVLAALIVSSLVVWIGDVDEAFSFDSVFEVWADVIRDVDQIGLQITRVSDAREMEIGRKLIAPLQTGSAEQSELGQYVTAVGNDLAKHMNRTGIAYEFHVLESNVANALALPGGQIVITTGMIDFLQSEAELAAILAHEMAHVDLRHCIERLQYALALEQTGAPSFSQEAANQLHQLVAAGYTKYQEMEADAQGVRVVIQAGYDPWSSAEVFNRMASHDRAPRSQASNPIDQVAEAVLYSLGSYFDTHPPTGNRMKRVEQLIGSARLPQRVYVGKQNFSRRISRSQTEFANEWRDLSN